MKDWKNTFTLIWVSQFLSIITSVTVNFAIILWITLETGSAQMLAWAAIAGLLPQALIGPVSGVFIDRWNRKRTMILADSFIALCTFILALLFWFDVARMWYIFILLALRSIGSAFHTPALQASVPLIVPKEQLVRISGLNQMINATGSIVGPALGALLITNMDIGNILLFDIFGAVCACTILFFVKIPNPERVVRKISGIFYELKESVNAVLQNRGLSWISLFVVLLTFFYMPISVLLPLMASNYFGGGEFEISLVEIAWGAGSLAGAALLGTRVCKVNRVVLLNVSYLVCGIAVFIPGSLPPTAFYWFVLLTATGGIAGGIYNSLFSAILQANIASGVLGRVFSMFYTLHIIPALLGITGIVFFTDTIGVKNSFLVCGLLLFIIGILAFTTPSALKLGKPDY